MAVKIIRRWPNLPWEIIGLAADTKPTEDVTSSPPEDVPPGSVFQEIDGNCVKSIFDGTTWHPIAGQTSIVGSLANEDEQLTIDATAGGIALTAAKYGTSTKAHIQVETAPIRFRINGSAPTATLGTILNIGGELTLDSAEDIANFVAIRTTAVSAIINCIYSS